MTTNKNRMWIVETSAGIAYIGYPVIFKDKATAQKFARRARRSKIKIAGKISVIEVEFYKGEMNGK